MFAINDPIHVNRGDQNVLEGVVAYIGTVDFDPTVEWIGIRLTGSSAGSGKNDGTVQGRQYFSCPDNCGLFVKPSHVSKRTLSRLEELRLRRELNSHSATTSMTHPSSTSDIPATSSSSRITSPSLLKSPSASSGLSKTSTATVVVPAAPATNPGPSSAPGGNNEPSSSSKTKLEELRKRRAMLNQKRDVGGIDATATTTTTSSTIPATGSGTAPSESIVSISRSASNVSDFDSHTGDVMSTTSAGAGASASTSAVANTLGALGSRHESVTDLRLRLNILNDNIKSKDNELLDLKRKLTEASETSKSKIQQLESTVQELKKDNEQQQQQNKQPIISPSKLAASYALPEDIQEQIMELETKNIDLVDKLEETVAELTTIRREYDVEKKSRLMMADELTSVRVELTTYQNQVQAMTDQSTARGQSDATHYKERAKLQAEISNYKRRIDLLEKEKLELENTVEDVTLDKEQLLEEKEAIEDRYEELKLDAETAQMEVEELKIELEDARATAERILQGQHGSVVPISSSPDGRGTVNTPSIRRSPGDSMDEDDNGGSGTTDDQGAELESAEMAQALQVQNARLREALIRLREQSQIEKMELTRQLRATEKHAQTATELQTDFAKQQELIATQDEQINDLKDMVEQGAAFETMVEDLSDRVLSLEEDNVMLQAVIREMEEAAELTAEMEEVQADEIKALTLDLESHKVIIRNLEEAIKIQRRREDDFRRTVGNYKTTVETLKQEKRALLELQQGGEGEKSDAIAASQKALAKAAQWVADAAATRKREAAAAYDSIEKIIATHASRRIEELLPHNVSLIAVETGAIRGELLGAKVIGITSKSLEGIESSFSKAIRPALPSDDESVAPKATTAALTLPKLTDENRQQVATMFHQVDFAHLLVEVSSDVLRLLIAGQWPDLLTAESSVQLGNILGSTLPDLDLVIQGVLKSVREEGALTVEQSNIGALTLTVQNTMQALKANVERDDQTIVPPTWNPPGWQLMRNASMMKFSCQGAAAALSSVVLSESSTVAVSNFYNRIEQCSSQASNVCQRLATMDLKNEKLVNTLHDIVTEAKEKSGLMAKAVQEMLLAGGSEDSGDAARVTTDDALRILTKLLSVLRGSGMNLSESGRYHPFSPEIGDAWDAVSNLTRKIRSIDGDSDDINFVVRTQKIESQLNTAIENEPKLVLAHQKVALLEKNLSNRSKEIAMQNARLSELEKIVAKSSSGGGGFGRNKALSSADLRSSEEYINLKEENRVLTEAMDVMQREVEMYENEIRALKDQKTPKRPGTATRGTPRRSMTTSVDLSSPHPIGLPTPGGTGGMGIAGDEFYGNTGVLEATLFRPALQNALREANRWKAAAVASSILDLPPLPSRYYNSDESKEADPNDSYSYNDDWIQLSSAVNHNRIVKASVRLVDLTGKNNSKPPRQQLIDMKTMNRIATHQLETAMLRSRSKMLSL